MENPSKSEKNFLVNKIVGALLFSVFGAMGFFYSLWKQNWNSAIWCFLVEVACTVLLVFNKSYVKSELYLKYSATFFRVFKYFAALFTVCSLVAFATYIAFGVVQKEEFTVQSHYAAAPVALIAAFWYFAVFFDVRKYESLLE